MAKHTLDPDHVQRLIEFAQKHPHEMVRVQSDEILEVALAAREMGFPPKLDTRPGRPGLLTDRECAKLIGSFIGGLADIATLDAIERAIQWWACHDEAWEAFKHMLAPDRLIDQGEPSS